MIAYDFSYFLLIFECFCFFLYTRTLSLIEVEMTFKQNQKLFSNDQKNSTVRFNNIFLFVCLQVIPISVKKIGEL